MIISARINIICAFKSTVISKKKKRKKKENTILFDNFSSFPVCIDVDSCWPGDINEEKNKLFLTT